MAPTQVSPLYDELLDYLVQKVTPQQILAFRVSEQAQQRADELTERNKAGELTAEEAEELAQMLEFDQLVSLLKAGAWKALADGD